MVVNRIRAPYFKITDMPNKDMTNRNGLSDSPSPSPLKLALTS